MDLRQSPQWGKYLSQIGWTIENIKGRQVFIRPIPFFNRSLIKIQRQKNPLPLKDIDRIAKKYKAFFVLIEPNHQTYDENLFKSYGFKPSKMSMAHTSTIEIDLKKDGKSLRKSFSENARRNIKKAQQNNLAIKVIYLDSCQTDQEFNIFFKLLKNLNKYKKFYLPSYGEFHKKMQAFKKNSVFLFAYSKDLSEPIAAVWMGYFEKTAVYMHTGITQKGYDLLANYLLVWEALKFAKKLKMEVFDFEGTFDPRYPKERAKWKNFTEFKKRFHGEEVYFPRSWIKIYNFPFKLLYLCNTIFSR